MAIDEELIHNAAPPGQVGTSELFLGVTGLTDVDALHAAASSTLAGLSAANNLRITIAYPGVESTSVAGDAVEAGLGTGAEVRFMTYPVPTPEGAASPWSQAAASQRALLALAAGAQAKVCVLVDPDLRILTSGAAERLALPVLEKRAELVLPVYTQGRYDGLLNTSILAPLTRALYGRRARFPLAGDFAVSARMVARLQQSAYTAAHVSAGSILWPVTVAATIDAPVCEAAVGLQHAFHTDGLELTAVLAQLVGSVFADMEHNAPLWQRVRGSQVMASSDTATAFHAAGPEAAPDPRPLIESLLLGSRSLQEVWGLVLPPVTLLELKRLTLTAPDKFRVPDDLWVRIVYDFALAFRLRVISRAHLLGALTPLYLGWVASYIHEVSGPGIVAPEQRHEQLAKAFEDGKPYLVRRWRWPDRFNP